MDDAIEAIFRADGHYREPPPTWQQPERALEESQFFAALQGCVEGLPPRLARVFMMREWLEQTWPRSAASSASRPTTPRVMLYRARMQLRECLNQRWFGEVR